VGVLAVSTIYIAIVGTRNPEHFGDAIAPADLDLGHSAIRRTEEIIGVEAGSVDLLRKQSEGSIPTDDSRIAVLGPGTIGAGNCSVGFRPPILLALRGRVPGRPSEFLPSSVSAEERRTQS
jgi:hypothetical protein